MVQKVKSFECRIVSARHCVRLQELQWNSNQCQWKASTKSFGQLRRERPQEKWTEDVRVWANKPAVICVRMAEDRERWRKRSQCTNGHKASLRAPDFFRTSALFAKEIPPSIYTDLDKAFVQRLKLQLIWCIRESWTVQSLRSIKPCSIHCCFEDPVMLTAIYL